MRVLRLFSMTCLLGLLSTPAPAQVPGRTPTAPVGASMALLATMQDADVLPPEGTPEANRVIQVVIQFQSVFMKSSDPAVQEFLHRALATNGTDSRQAVDRLRSKGWSSKALDAMSAYYATLTPGQRTRLEEGFSPFNMHLRDFEYLIELFDNARSSFDRRGQDIHRVFAERRREMPGNERQNRKERRNGDQGLYSYQGEGGAHERRPAVPQETGRC